MGRRPSPWSAHRRHVLYLAVCTELIKRLTRSLDTDGEVQKPFWRLVYEGRPSEEIVAEAPVSLGRGEVGTQAAVRGRRRRRLTGTI